VDAFVTTPADLYDARLPLGVCPFRPGTPVCCLLCPFPFPLPSVVWRETSMCFASIHLQYCTQPRPCHNSLPRMWWTRLLDPASDHLRPFRRRSRATVCWNTSECFGILRSVFPSAGHSPWAFLMHSFNVETRRRFPWQPPKIFARSQFCVYATLLSYTFGIAFVASAAIFWGSSSELPDRILSSASGLFLDALACRCRHGAVSGLCDLSTPFLPRRAALLKRTSLRPAA